MEPFDQLQPDNDKPGLYYVNVYHVKVDGTLEDSTTRLQYRARNAEMALARTRHQYPHASVVNVDFHKALDDYEEETDFDLFTTESPDDPL